MRKLTSLYLEFNPSLSNYLTLEKFDSIYDYSIHITTFTIVGRFDSDDILLFVDYVIGNAKLRPRSRSSLLTVNIGSTLSILEEIEI